MRGQPKPSLIVKSPLRMMLIHAAFAFSYCGRSGFRS